MLQSSVGDELKMSGKGGKVIGISLKDRSAILPAGRMGDAAYWDNWAGATGPLYPLVFLQGRQFVLGSSAAARIVGKNVSQMG